MTECSQAGGDCDLVATCGVADNWQRVSLGVRTLLDSRYGDALYNEGLRVYTSLDLEIQRYAQAAMDSGWARIEKMPGFRHPKYDATVADPKRRESPESPYLQGLLVALDPASGEVRALVGGRDFAASQVNLALGGSTGRQPGSGFKPFVLAEALEQGVSPNKTYSGRSGICFPGVPEQYCPENYGGASYGTLTLREATKRSVNTVFVQLLNDVGIEKTMELAHRHGVSRSVSPDTTYLGTVNGGWYLT